MSTRTNMPAGCANHRRWSALSRRGFVKAGVLGAFGLSLSDFHALRARAGTLRRRAQSVIVIYAGGGISHHDSFDPKEQAPREVRGELATIATSMPGVRFSDHVPRLARDASRFTLIRSVNHTQADHGVSAYYMLRGYPQPDPSLDRPENQLRSNPNIGSHVARLLGSPNGLPPYMCVPGLSYLATIGYYTSGWMGRSYDPFVLKADPNDAEFRPTNLALELDVPLDRLNARRALRENLDARRLRDREERVVTGLGENYRQAYEALNSKAARNAFDINAEPAATRDAFGRTRMGQSCLLARRLVEAGVPFVTVDDDAWDHHTHIFPSLRERLPELDQAVAALLGDLDERGLLDTTLVALLTDFGRTPKVNKDAGRDHWPGVFSVLLAGAGVPGGLVIGASDRLGAAPAERPISPKDLAATLYAYLGIDPFQQYKSVDGRPLLMLDEGSVPAELR